MSSVKQALNIWKQRFHPVTESTEIAPLSDLQRYFDLILVCKRFLTEDGDVGFKNVPKHLFWCGNGEHPTFLSAPLKIAEIALGCPWAHGLSTCRSNAAMSFVIKIAF